MIDTSSENNNRNIWENINGIAAICTILGTILSFCGIGILWSPSPGPDTNNPGSSGDSGSFGDSNGSGDSGSSGSSGDSGSFGDSNGSGDSGSSGDSNGSGDSGSSGDSNGSGDSGSSGSSGDSNGSGSSETDGHNSDNVSGYESSILPVIDATVLDGDFDTIKGECKDIYGNSYLNCIKVNLGGVRTSISHGFSEYVLNGKYDGIRGTLFTSDEAPRYNEFQLEIIADDIHVYTSPTITMITEPINFDVSITNANTVKLQFILIHGTTNMADGWYEKGYGYLANAEFYQN